MPPQKILNFMGALRCFLVHLGAGVLTGITNTTQQKEDYRKSIELSRKMESSCSILTTEYGISSPPLSEELFANSIYVLG